MKDEISWEFSRKSVDNEFATTLDNDENIRYVLSGRTGFDLIIRDIKKKGLKLNSCCFPSYCSTSMMQAFADNGISIEFYDAFIGEDGFDFNASRNDCDAIVLIDYFGYCSNKLPALSAEAHKCGCIVIVDVTQSLFCDRNYYAFSDYVVGSFRKWLPSCSALVYSRDGFSVGQYHTFSGRFEELRNRAYSIKQQYIQSNDSCPERFLSIFEESELMLKSDYSGYAALQQELNIYLNADYDFIRTKRRENAKVITERLSQNKGIRPINSSVQLSDCPLFVPLLLNSGIDRDKVRRKLFADKIFLPVHWRISTLHRSDWNKRPEYTSILSCICDQRYSINDMDRICYAIIEKLN